MKSEVFALSTNAFCLLGASYTSTASEISEFLEEAQFEGTVRESDLHKAQQALVTPRLRLAEELGWLPELSQAQIERVLKQRHDLPSGALLQSVEMLPELARANLIADLCGREGASIDVVSVLLTAWNSIENDPLFDFLVSGRRASGFPAPDWKNFLIALQDVKELHAVTATASLLMSVASRDAIRTLVDGNSSEASPSSFLTLMVKEYEKQNEAALSRIAEELDEAVETGKSQPIQIQASVAKIHKLMLEWMELLGPVSQSYVSRGLTEPRSKALFQKARAFTLYLANDEDRYEDARKLALALLTCFIAYQELTKVAEKDLNDLDDLIKEQKDLELFQPLYNACDEAKSHYFEFSQALKAQGLNAGSSDPVGALVRATNSFIAGNGNPNVGVNVLRDLALTCNNDHGDPEVSYLLTQFVLERFRTFVDDEMVVRLEDDAGTVFKNWKISDLEKNSRDLSWMIEQLQGIVAVAPNTVRREFSNMLELCIEARRKKRVKWAWIAGIAAIIIVPAILAENKKSAAPRSSYTPSTTTTSKTTHTPTVDDFQESVPPIGVSLTLSKQQIRYCVYQNRRLDLLRTTTATNAAVDKFNALVDDYNNRCSNFRYRGSDLSSVEREAVGRTAQFQQEAANLSRSW